LRSTHKRKSTKAVFETQILDRFDAAAWAEYEAIYAESWKPEEGSPEFLKSLAESEGEAGTLRLGLCRVGGEPVAAQFWTVENRTALIHKLAYKASAGDLSPGTILSAAMFRHVIDVDHVQRIDFGTGDDTYKADWMDTRSPLFRIKAFNTSTAAGLVGAGKGALSRLVGR
jgi:CelD/BcsL family acetyltransferase involved in cellulose biosynthesis